MVVSDASVLIALAKIGKLEMLRELFGKVWMSLTVKTEALDAGVRVGAIEVGNIRRAVDDGWLHVARLSTEEKKSAQRLTSTIDLDQGEAESIAIARSRHLLLIVDDKEARSAAKSLGLDYMGSAAVLFQAYAVGKISLDDFEKELGRLASVIWLSPSVVAELLRRARRLGK